MSQQPLAFEQLSALFEISPQFVRSVASVRRLHYAPLGSATFDDFAEAVAEARGELHAPPRGSKAAGDGLPSASVNRSDRLNRETPESRQLSGVSNASRCTLDGAKGSR